MTLIAIIASTIALVLLVLVLVLAAKLKDERLAWKHERQAWQAKEAGWGRERNALVTLLKRKEETIVRFVNATQRANNQGRKTRELRQGGSLDGSHQWGDIR